jgi:hypothetical protein
MFTPNVRFETAYKDFSIYMQKGPIFYEIKSFIAMNKMFNNTYHSISVKPP